MKRFSTRCMDELTDKIEKKRDNIKCMPRKKTLDFLTQFARVYHVEPDVNKEFCGIVMN
ncbi:MAG: hypothetical protein LBH58_01925 [Tannerellaceae bacterium]|nr:hypothetical protein [Tannerellaceae bacterium]